MSNKGLLNVIEEMLTEGVNDDINKITADNQKKKEGHGSSPDTQGVLGKEKGAAMDAGGEKDVGGMEKGKFASDASPDAQGILGKTKGAALDAGGDKDVGKIDGKKALPSGASSKVEADKGPHDQANDPGLKEEEELENESDELEEKKMDSVDQDELKGDHKDRKDKDIDNDGDVDSSDEYLHKRRKAISKAMKEDADVLDEETGENLTDEQIDEFVAGLDEEEMAEYEEKLEIVYEAEGETLKKVSGEENAKMRPEQEKGKNEPETKKDPFSGHKPHDQGSDQMETPTKANPKGEAASKSTPGGKVSSVSEEFALELMEEFELINEETGEELTLEEAIEFIEMIDELSEEFDLEDDESLTEAVEYLEEKPRAAPKVSLPDMSKISGSRGSKDMTAGNKKNREADKKAKERKSDEHDVQRMNVTNSSSAGKTNAGDHAKAKRRELIKTIAQRRAGQAAGKTQTVAPGKAKGTDAGYKQGRISKAPDSTGNQAFKNANKRTPDKKYEDIEVEGESLDEDFKARAEIIFETAVNEKASMIREEMEAEFAEKLNEAKEELNGQVSQYVEEAVQEWINENALEIKYSLRTEIAENFISGLKGLFEESYVEIPEEDYSVVDELTEAVETYKEQLEETTESLAEMKAELLSLKKASIVESVSDDLTETQKVRLESLAENVEADSIEEFEYKLKELKEGYFDPKSEQPFIGSLTEEVFTGAESVNESVDPAVAIYANFLGKTVK